jgi:type I restriction enzyme R subunit
MSEYDFVEKPFLIQLAALGWEVLDQGQGFPSDPAKCLRASFREVALPDVFREAVRDINRTEEGEPWLTDKQLDELLEQVLDAPGSSLVEINEQVLKLLYRAQVDRNELTGEEYPDVRLIDFQHPERNRFTAINQFRIDTPGRVKDCIIPDIVLFVNGLPLVVVECKEANQVQANPLYEAFRQLMRYSDQRLATHEAGLREGEPRLFYTNQLLIRTTGDKAEFGSITATEEEFFFPWRDIYPEKYRQYEPPLGKGNSGDSILNSVLPRPHV